MTSSDKRLLTRREIEARYGISKRFLEISAQRGDGPRQIRLSRTLVRYRVSDIEAWLDARRVPEKARQRYL